MLSIALTGGIGCGKSTVCNYFQQLGTPVIDTDIISRELVKPGMNALTKITDYFGSTILLADGTLDRKALAHEIFNNQKSKSQLESILHPAIRHSVKEAIGRLNSSYAIIAIPLLVETHQENNYDRVLVIDCDEKQQIERTINRDHRSLNDVKSIIRSQVSRQRRRSVADDVIDNTQDIETLKNRINQLHNKYLKLDIT